MHSNHYGGLYAVKLSLSATRTNTPDTAVSARSQTIPKKDKEYARRVKKDETEGNQGTRKDST